MTRALKKSAFSDPNFWKRSDIILPDFFIYKYAHKKDELYLMLSYRFNPNRRLMSAYKSTRSHKDIRRQNFLKSMSRRPDSTAYYNGDVVHTIFFTKGGWQRSFFPCR